MDEALAEQQRAAYKMPGVDDDEPAVDPTKKRKAVEAENVRWNVSACSQCVSTDLNAQETAKKQKSEKPKERVNTAVYVESLPKDVNEEELFDCFSRYGVIAESIDDNKPRIKMYYNENGEFNGDALIGKFCHRPSASIPNTHHIHSLLPPRVCQPSYQHA
jgi:HIV Tat-specific factor 1